LKNRLLTRIVRKIDYYLIKYRDKPIVSENFTDALLNNNEYFWADMNKCIDPYGYSYGDGWQFFSSMGRNMDKYSSNAIVEDFAKFLNLTYHENAYEGFRLEFRNSEGLKNYSSSCLAFLTPWSLDNIADIENRVKKIIKTESHISGVRYDRKDHFEDQMSHATLHFDRLFHLRKSIKEKGYNFLNDPGDPVKGFVLVRKKDHRILIFSGQHRVAALSGLNYTKIPVKFYYKYIINTDSAADWPLVKNGLWDQQDAIHYFNHLFDFDSRSWAAENGLME
jgi:hypothetical protein